MSQTLETERDIWNFYCSVESVGEKAYLDRVHSILKECLREISFREWVLKWAEIARGGESFPKRTYGYLNQVHPEAFQMIGRYGIEYAPMLWNEPPVWGEPKPRSCYGNAFELMRSINHANKRLRKPTRLLYVEGIAWGAAVNPMLHAWNANRMENGQYAFDWTFYATTGWALYLGIPLTEPEYARARKIAYPPDGKRFHLLFKKETFPNVRGYLIDVLEKRKETLKAAS